MSSLKLETDDISASFSLLSTQAAVVKDSRGTQTDSPSPPLESRPSDIRIVQRNGKSQDEFIYKLSSDKAVFASIWEEKALLTVHIREFYKGFYGDILCG